MTAVLLTIVALICATNFYVLGLERAYVAPIPVEVTE